MPHTKATPVVAILAAVPSPQPPLRLSELPDDIGFRSVTAEICEPLFEGSLIFGVEMVEGNRESNKSVWNYFASTRKGGMNEINPFHRSRNSARHARNSLNCKAK